MRKPTQPKAQPSAPVATMTAADFLRIVSKMKQPARRRPGRWELPARKVNPFDV